MNFIRIFHCRNCLHCCNNKASIVVFSQQKFTRQYAQVYLCAKCVSALKEVTALMLCYALVCPFPRVDWVNWRARLPIMPPTTKRFTRTRATAIHVTRLLFKTNSLEAESQPSMPLCVLVFESHQSWPWSFLLLDSGLTFKEQARLMVLESWLHLHSSVRSVIFLPCTDY